MGIFFCFCNSCLCHIMGCKEFTKCICDTNFLKCNLLIRNSFIIFGKAHKFRLDSFCSFKSVKFICTECSCNFSCPVRTEIEENYGIAIFNCSCFFSGFCNDNRLYKFIRNICCIGSFHCLHRTLCGFSFSFCHGKISLFHSVPSVISVHGIITSTDGSYLSNAKFFHLVT